MATLYNLVSRDAQVALTEFSEQFDAALVTGEILQWATQYGLPNTSNAIQTTYPLPVDAAGYKERKGDDKMRELFERSMSIKPKEWQDGVVILAKQAEAPDFVGWVGAPARMAKEALRQPNKLVAAMLEANPYLDLYRSEHAGGSVASTIRLFADNHPVNIFDSSFGTFGNAHTITGINATSIGACKTRFRQKKGPNGEPLGLRFTHLLVPAALEEIANDFFQSDNLVLAIENQAGTENVGGTWTNNRHKGTIQVVVCDELTDATKVYALDGSSGAFPWIVQTTGAPELIEYTKQDQLYKDTGKIGVKYVLTMGVAAALPHAIECLTIS